MDIFRNAIDIIQGFGSGDSPQIKAILKELALPRRTAAEDSLVQRATNAAHFDWLKKSFSWHLKDLKAGAADDDTVRRASIVDPWRSAILPSDRERVTLVVQDFLSRYLLSCSDRKLIWLSENSEFRDRKGSNSVVESHVRGFKTNDGPKVQAIALLEIKDENGCWLVRAVQQDGFISSSQPALISVMATVEIRSPGQAILQLESQNTVGSLSVVRFCGEEIARYSSAVWRDDE